MQSALFTSSRVVYTSFPKHFIFSYAFKDSPDLKEALKCIMELCFEDLGTTEGGVVMEMHAVGTPLAALTILMRLGPYVQGGSKPE